MVINRVVAYLGSRKNVVGCLGGIVGLVLGAFGFGGSWWWVLVVGLYAAGALATPPGRVTLASGSSSLESTDLRSDLATLVARVDAVAGRLPAGAPERVRETAAMLFEVLDRPDALNGSPDNAYAVSRVVRSDLPTSLETYLKLPKWYATGKPGDELLTQLGLIRDDTRRVAESVYADDARRLADHTRYLQERDRSSSLEDEGD